MIVSEVRKRYLDFFKERGHAVIPSAPITPENDPTTLFTSSGMQPLVPYLLGAEHPEGTRLVNAQTCFRADDIEEVGDNRHTTFFEMLGNWSLGDYFKKEQIPWVFAFLTDKEAGLGLDPSRLYVTVFAGDNESGMAPDMETVGIWKELFAEKGIEADFVEVGTEEEGYRKGMQGGRIFSYGAKKNWWSRAGVPKNMPAGEPGGPDSEVFYDFGSEYADPSYEARGMKLHPNSDSGQFIEIGNSVFMQFVKQEDGTFKELPKRNVDFGGGLERLTAATQGNPDVFLIDVFDAARRVIQERSGKSYGDTEEITRAYRIILDHVRAATFMLAQGIRPSNTEAGYVLRRLIRRAIREADRLGITDAALSDIAEGFGEAYKDAYPAIAESAESIRNELKKEEDKFRKTLAQGMREFEKRAERGGIDGTAAFLLFTTYGFPVELSEEMAKEKGVSIDTESFQKLMTEHQEKSRAGSEQKFKGGLADNSEITVRYHTAHHLLLRALQEVLGKEVHQRGSNITVERLRIDFSFERKMTPEEIVRVEEIVNEKIAEEIPMIRTVMPREEAEKLGAEREFGVKYPDMVSVYSLGPKDATSEDPKFNEAFSIEFCGGPHVTNTKEIGKGGKRFKIKKEEASSAGVRRIKAVLE